MANKKAMLFGAFAEVPLTYISASGVIPLVEGRYILNGASAQAMTLALPTQTISENGNTINVPDGTVIEIVSNSAHAHTVTTPADGINGADDTVTFGGAIGNLIKLLAVSGSWVVIGTSGATLSEV